MPGFLFHVGAVMTCGHAGQAKVVTPGQSRVLVGGQPVATATAQILVTGCPGVPPAPPCTKVQWTGLASRVRATGSPVLVQATVSGPGNGICAGPPPPVPIVVSVQPRVRGL
ncbi:MULTISPECIES: hypothetical protein [unclassified Crossiella]|uniref:hypothetical protein n=1 Tax=unclassified Crossiella TaxID=2620835 RepID=UPI00200024DF|nr:MULTISPECIES: hypothetical protein [unclassified Crossiella]MCK2242809.1 hypothetical protein [Crossiella sp. S99.2]MCK2256686.1 hypothetical protein [Crossiella sp. S99.1]